MLARVRRERSPNQRQHVQQKDTADDLLVLRLGGVGATNGTSRDGEVRLLTGSSLGLVLSDSMWRVSKSSMALLVRSFDARGIQQRRLIL